MRNLYHKLWLAALPLAFAACQNDEMVVEQPAMNKTIYTLHCVMGNYAPQSRAQVEIGNADVKQEQFMWNSGDAFTLYDHADIDGTANVAEPVTTTFTIADYKDEAPSASADFLGEGELADGHTVTAIYPVQVGAVNEALRPLVIPDFSAAPMGGNTEEDQKAYMSSRMFMYADGIMGQEQTNLTFNHLCAMARVSYTNATDSPQSLSALALRGDGEYFGEIMDFNVLTGDNSVSKTSAQTALTFDDLKVESGRTVDFYLLFFPGQTFVSNGTLSLDVTDVAGAKYTVSMPVSDISGNNNGATIFESGKRYWFNVMQTNVDGLIWKKDVVEGVISNRALIQLVESQNSVMFNKDENGFINVAANKDELENVRAIYSSWGNLNNLEGIEYFTHLEELWVEGSNLRKLDVSQNTQLKTLKCSENKLARLDVTACTQLEILECRKNKLTELDLSKNTALKELSCSENDNLVRLDVTACTQLEYLDCFHISLAELDVTHNSKLIGLYCGGNQLSVLDISKNVKLEELDLWIGRYGGYGNSWTPANLVTSLDLSCNPELRVLELENCQLLTSLDVSKNTKLTRLRCGGTDISSLDISKNVLLEHFDCNNAHRLASLDVSNNVNLTELRCYWTGIASLDVSKNTALIELVCCNENLSSLDVSNNTKLTHLDCEGSRLFSLDISNNTELTHLLCYGNRLSALDITKNTKLQEIRVGNQRDENYENIQLVLTLLSSQKAAIWDGQPEYDWGNEHVTVNVVDD